MDAVKKLIVYDENTLAVLNPVSGMAQVLSSSVIGGATLSFGAVFMPIESRTRIASEKDFETFRVHFKGYANRNEFIYN